jgi:CRP/FNR family transcriptional regulator, cyclic AMP receptor protein
LPLDPSAWTVRARCTDYRTHLEKSEMSRVLHTERKFSNFFISYMLTRNIEADLVDQLFNSIEKRLARALVLLAQCGKDDRKRRTAYTSYDNWVSSGY